MKKFLSICMIVSCLAAILFPKEALAYGSSPYSAYEYNEFSEAIETPIGYVLSDIIDSASLGLTVSMDGIQSIARKNGYIYLLDSGNSRILVISEKFELVKTYENFTVDKEVCEKYGILNADETVELSGAKDIAVRDDGTIYIADTLGNRVLVMNAEGEIFEAILRPDENLNDTEAAFSPVAVEIDEDGWVYVASDSISQGLMVFSADGEFKRFFAANRVMTTTEALVQWFRESFMTLTQLEFVAQNSPVTIYNMDFDDNEFLYTVSPYSDEKSKVAVSGLVKKYNYQSEDVLDDTLVFGDIEEGKKKTWFQDVDIDDDGFMYLLDTTRGRIFQYTDDGMLLSVFGAIGDQKGAFSKPTAIETVSDYVLVADSQHSCIFVFEPTEYGKTVRQAVLLMKNNDLEGSEEVWNDLLKQNSNSSLCYKGLGRIYDYKGDFATAMKYYKMANAQEEYALSFKNQRQIFIEENIVWLVVVLAAVIVLFVMCDKYMKRLLIPGEDSYSKLEQKYTMQFYALLHPIDAFSQFKIRNIGSYLVSVVIVVIWFFSKVLEYNYTGFSFSINRTSDFNLFSTLLVTFGLFILFVVANWAICTLIEGKGTIRDIVSVTAYSLIPYVVTRILMVIMTNVFVPEESVFIQIVSVVGILWSFMVLLLGLMSIHDFTVGKTILSLALTLFGIAVIVFLIVLIYSLMQQMVNFFLSVYKEIIFRI